jgi:hypothetical protein
VDSFVGLLKAPSYTDNSPDFTLLTNSGALLLWCKHRAGDVTSQVHAIIEAALCGLPNVNAPHIAREFVGAKIRHLLIPMS